MTSAKLASRRDLLKIGSCGFGYVAFASLATQEAKAAASSEVFQSPLAVADPVIPARVKRVIFLFMQGGPSHVDTFDHKPELEKLAESGPQKGKSDELLPSPWQFRRHGESGLPISELFPRLARHADDLCLINGAHTDNPAHPQATIMLHTGSINFVRPSMGSWIVYGLGSENRNLPGFVTINPPENLGGAQNYGCAFLPAAYQGTRVSLGGAPIPHIRRHGVTPQQQRRHLDLIQALNRDLLVQQQVDSEVEGIIESYELAFRMQTSVPDLVDIRHESARTKEMYGIGQKSTSAFGKQCLMARRLAEAGVRFIELTHRGWDQHNNLKTKLPQNCLATDQPISALLSDLKQRGLFDDTLVVWSGEFGRTPAAQNAGLNGRRHNHRGFTMWMAGGGIKGGLRYGATDPTGYEAVSNKVHTHDVHATILHLLGLDHERLTYRYSGRDFRLTDVHGRVVDDVIS